MPHAPLSPVLIGSTLAPPLPPLPLLVHFQDVMSPSTWSTTLAPLSLSLSCVITSLFYRSSALMMSRCHRPIPPPRVRRRCRIPLSSPSRSAPPIYAPILYPPYCCWLLPHVPLLVLGSSHSSLTTCATPLLWVPPPNFGHWVIILAAHSGLNDMTTSIVGRPPHPWLTSIWST
jgi:hypothetical protein